MPSKITLSRGIYIRSVGKRFDEFVLSRVNMLVRVSVIEK